MDWVVDAGIIVIKAKNADTNALATAFMRQATIRGKLVSLEQYGKQNFDQQFEINQAIVTLEMSPDVSLEH